MARDTIGEESFNEVYVKAGIEACRQRDPKGLHKTGMTSRYELPDSLALILDTE